MLEGDAVVGRLEQSAGGGGYPVGGGVGVKRGDGGDAAAHVGRADAAPTECFGPIIGNRTIGNRFGGIAVTGFLVAALDRLEFLIQLGDLLLNLSDLLITV